MNLIVENLDDIAHGDNADEFGIVHDRHLGDVAFAHLAHDLADIIIEVTRDGVVAHQVGDTQPAEAVAPAMNHAQDVALTEHADQIAVVINHRQRADVVLHELGNGFADGRLGIDRKDAATLGNKDISDKHEAPPRYRACERGQQLENRPTNALDLRKGRVTLTHRDIIFRPMQILFSGFAYFRKHDVASGLHRFGVANNGSRCMLIFLLVMTFWIRFVNGGQPIVENYVGRQIPTAMVARNLERGSGFFRPQLETAPFPNYFLVEPPLYQSAVIVLRRLTGGSLAESGRTLSALACVMAAAGLFVLARRREGTVVALLAVAAFAVVPLTIRYGRAFQPDAAMLGAVVLGLASWDRHQVTGRWRWLAAAWLLVGIGFALKITAACLLVPLGLVIARPRSVRGALVVCSTLLPALLWYAWANHVVGQGTGSLASADNRTIWLGLFGPSALFRWETLRFVTWFLVVRAFTPRGAGLAVFGLCYCSAPRGRRDALWLVWVLATLGAMACLAEKLRHEYYWLLLAPVAAVGIGRSLAWMVQSRRPLAITAAAMLVLLCAFQVRSTWRTPREWDGLLSAARAVATEVPADDWVVAPEALLFHADRRGCRMEWTKSSVVRAAGEWGHGYIPREPIELVEYYRQQGARYFADLGGGPADLPRKGLHDAVRQRYKVIVDRPDVIIAELADCGVHGNAR
jgi:hypothetical protein